MRLEFLLTIDDFREATEANLVAAVRPRGSLKAIALVWQFATMGIEAVLVWKFDPWASRRQWTSDVVNLLITPSVPWLMILGYLLWYSLRSVRIATTAMNPWEIRNATEAKPVRRKPGMKSLLNGVFTLGVGITVIVVCIKKHLNGTMDGGDEFFYALGLGLTPWGVFQLWGAALKFGQTRREINTAWERQTQLQHPVIMQFAHDGIIHETPLSRTEFKWHYFVGARETPGLFILYASASLFYIVPKRAALSETHVEGLRNMLKQFIGAKPLGFPVLPAAPLASLADDIAPDVDRSV